MKRFLIAAAVAVITVTTFSTSAFALDISVPIRIGQPDFYGRLDTSSYPSAPRILYIAPKIVRPVRVSRPPIYMRVPAGHASTWSRHCQEYGACSERVLFVTHDWYNREYAPRYQVRPTKVGENRNDDYDKNRGNSEEHRNDDHDKNRGNSEEHRNDDHSKNYGNSKEHKKDKHGNKHGNKHGKGHGD